VLKGGFALDLRLGTRARPTKDLDLARGDAVEQATVDLLPAQATDIGDYFVFAVERSEDLDDVLEGAAVRYRVTASLAGRRFEPVVVDVGFGDPLPAQPDLLPGPGLIAFAEVDLVRFPTLPLDQHELPARGGTLRAGSHLVEQPAAPARGSIAGRWSE
jgi:hypothetical protein